MRWSDGIVGELQRMEASKDASDRNNLRLVHGANHPLWGKKSEGRRRKERKSLEFVVKDMTVMRVTEEGT